MTSFVNVEDNLSWIQLLSFILQNIKDLS